MVGVVAGITTLLVVAMSVEGLGMMTFSTVVSRVFIVLREVRICENISSIDGELAIVSVCAPTTMIRVVEVSMNGMQ